MSEKVKQKKWRLLLTIVTFVAFIVTIVILRHQIFSTAHNLKKINIWVISLMIPIEFFNYHAQAKLYQDILKTLKHKIKYGLLFRFSLELNFISTIFPSGGLSGFSYTTVRLKSRGVSGAQSTLIQLLKFVVVFLSFLGLLILGVIALAVEGRANEVIILIAGSIVTLLVVFTFAIAFIVGSEARINGFFTYITRILNRLIKIFRPRVSETISIERVRRVFTELHLNYLEFRNDRKVLLIPLFWGMVANITEVASLYVTYVAFGHWVNPGGIIMAYAVANFAGAVSVLPGGIGVYETLMTIVLAAAGISPSLSIPITVMYRIVNTLIQIAPGYLLYQRALDKKTLANG